MIRNLFRGALLALGLLFAITAPAAAQSVPCSGFINLSCVPQMFVNALGLGQNVGVANPLPTLEACTGVINISQTSTTDVHTFAAYGYVCSIVLVSATAQNIGVDEGTGTTCETNGTALIAVSSTSAATPTAAVAANGGFVDPAPFKTQASGDHLCVLQSSNGNVSGIITYIPSAS